MSAKRSFVSAFVPAWLVGLALLACSARVHGREYDAESDIGLVADSRLAAKVNTERLSAALGAQWSGGKFKFANGQIGPILDPIRAAGKEFFFAGTIETSRRMGGALFGVGSRSFPLASGAYAPNGSLGGAVTRFTRVDGEQGGAILRLRGAGFTVDGIEFGGRPYITDPTGEGPRKGTKTPVGIEVEGHIAPATGKHVIRNCTIAECTYGICARAGYYESGKFVPYENHADNSNVDGVSFQAVDSCFRSENPQSVSWRLRDIFVSGWGGAGANQTVVCDIVKGGGVVVDGLELAHPRVTIFKVHDYSHTTQRLVCNNFRWDHFAGPTDYLTLFYYDGPIYKDMSGYKWTVRIDGHIANDENHPPYDVSKLLHVPPGFPMDDIKFDISRLPALKP